MDKDHPDFGTKIEIFQGMELSCRYYAPGLTLQDLTEIHEAAYNHPENNRFAGNPGLWPSVRATKAVADAVIKAMVNWKPEKENDQG